MVRELLWTRLKRATKIALLIVLLVSLTGVVYLAVEQPSANDPYTEFYTLGSGENASDYPNNLTVNESGRVIVGISNHERENLTYDVEFRLNGTVLASDAITVAEGQTREQLMSFSIEEPGRHRVRIELYKGQSPDPATEPYRILWLWVEVLNPDATES